ncbi:hydroxyacylglutathione hydrolase [Chytriomyces confervae]|uniref:hydroxyacylglutathione hydrolase n=1 Tax=Chytriomyces confervae TaxID=246404 RepID=A0A507F1B2_9FUNG|nr:hypothetical protein HDU80_003337 [Chytriomyces hyalinus]TPX69178.1 hydroxyacylglutathione hydrolase [Chytriomyces confervae]
MSFVSRNLFTAATQRMGLRVVPVAVNADNYAYLLQTDAAKGLCAAVDPCEPDKVIAKATQLGWRIEAVLTTHHHADHSGGNSDLVRLLSPEQIPVFGGDDRIPSMTHKVTDKSAFKLGQVEITPFFTVCHTRGSVSYYVTTPESSEKAVFTGDTLFVGGCGRFFEGTAEEMHKSLNTILGSLPDETSVYCGHEYTASNLSFAASIEPENREIATKLAWAKSVPCTVPSTLGEEKRINPFMRVGIEQVRQACGGLLDPVAVMAALREKKNNFR